MFCSLSVYLEVFFFFLSVVVRWQVYVWQGWCPRLWCLWCLSVCLSVKINLCIGVILLDECLNPGPLFICSFVRPSVRCSFCLQQVTHEPEYHDEVSQTGTWKAPASYPQLSEKEKIDWNSPYEKKFRQESVSYPRSLMKIEPMGCDSTFVFHSIFSK